MWGKVAAAHLTPFSRFHSVAQKHFTLLRGAHAYWAGQEPGSPLLAHHCGGDTVASVLRTPPLGWLVLVNGRGGAGTL